MKLDKNKTGIVVGIYLAFVHLAWSLCVAVIPSMLQSFVDWILKLHHIGMAIAIQPFSIINAVILVIVTFVFGFIIGWIFAFAWNWLNKK